MAFPQYNPYYQQPYYAPNQMQNPVQNIVQGATQQNQASGMIMNIPNEDNARSYPVAPGNSVIFKDENAPYIYTKTMGFSQFDKPVFEKYRLVKEEDEMTQEHEDTSIVDELKNEIASLKSEIESIKKKIAPKTVKRIMKEIEVDDDDTE